MSIPSTFPVHSREPFVPKKSASCPQFRTRVHNTKICDLAVRELLLRREAHFIYEADGSLSFKGRPVNMPEIISFVKSKGMRIYESYMYIPGDENRKENIQALVLTTFKPVLKCFPEV